MNGHVTIEAFAGQKIDNYEDLATRIRGPAGRGLGAAGAGRPGAAEHRGECLAAAAWCAASARTTCTRCIGSAITSSPGTLDDFNGDNAMAIGVGFAQSPTGCGIGDLVTLISPEGAATAFGTIPRVRAYKVVAIFDAGLHDYNSIRRVPAAAGRADLTSRSPTR